MAIEEENLQELVNHWAILIQIEKPLMLLYEATLKLQAPDIGLSDLYGMWLLSEIKIKVMITPRTRINVLIK